MAERIPLHEKLRDALRDVEFHAPATAGDLERVERELNCEIPKDLRQLYLNFNGFYCERTRVQMLPLVVEEPRPRGSTHSVVTWNQFCRLDDWQWQPRGFDPRTVLLLGFLNDDEALGIRLSDCATIVIERRGAVVREAQLGIAESFIAAHAEASKLLDELNEHIFSRYRWYAPVERGHPSHRGIDEILAAVKKRHQGMTFYEPQTPDGLPGNGPWVNHVMLHDPWEQIRLVSPSGEFPFSIESDVSRSTQTVFDPESAADVILREYELHCKRVLDAG